MIAGRALIAGHPVHEAQVYAQPGSCASYIINPRRAAALQRTAAALGITRYAEREQDIAALWDEVAGHSRQLLDAYEGGSQDAFARWAVVIDDMDLAEPVSDAADVLQQLVLRGADVGAVVVAASDTQAIRSSYPSGAMRSLLNRREGLLLRPGTADDFDLFGVRGKPARVPPGRGYFCSGGEKHPVQVFLCWK